MRMLLYKLSAMVDAEGALEYNTATEHWLLAGYGIYLNTVDLYFVCVYPLPLTITHRHFNQNNSFGHYFSGDSSGVVLPS